MQWFSYKVKLEKEIRKAGFVMKAEEQLSGNLGAILSFAIDFPWDSGQMLSESISQTFSRCSANFGSLFWVPV